MKTQKITVRQKKVNNLIFIDISMSSLKIKIHLDVIKFVIFVLVCFL